MFFQAVYLPNLRYSLNVSLVPFRQTFEVNLSRKIHKL